VYLIRSQIKNIFGWRYRTFCLHEFCWRFHSL
jgi:hypothetical protein